MSTPHQRALAQALLPASILPVLLLGPGLVRAPQTLWRRGSAEVRRLVASPAQAGHHRAPGASLARGHRGAIGARVQRDAHLFPGARYAPLRVGVKGAPPGEHPARAEAQAAGEATTAVGSARP